MIAPLVLALALHAPAAAAQGLQALAPAPELRLEGALPDEEPVLVIDGQTISWGEYSRWLVRTIGERQAIEFALDYYTVEREAARRQVDVPQEEIAAGVQRDLALRIEKAFHGRPSEWRDELERTGRTESGVRAERALEARRELLGRAIAALGRVVPEEKIVREWQLRHGRHGLRFELLMMQFRSEPVSPEKFSREEWRAREAASKEEARTRALAARARLEAGADFETLASQLSEDPDTRLHRGRPAGGFADPGWPASFLDALEKLEEGALSEPVYAKGGWWLVRPLRIARTPLAQVRRGIELDLLARGPDPDEIGAVHERVKEGVAWKVLPAMWSNDASGERPDMLEPVLAVDGEPVSKGVYARFLARMQGETMASTFAESYLVQKRARELGVSCTLAEAEERAQAYLDELAKDSPLGTRESWQELQKNGVRTAEALLHEYTFRSLTDVLAEKLIRAQRTFTPEDLRRAYDEAYGKEGERLELRLLALPVRLPSADPGWSREELDRNLAQAAAKTEAQARELMQRVRAGADFAELARAESCDARTRGSGGLLAEPFRSDRWSAEIYAAVRAAPAGALVGPLRQGSTCFVFQVLARHKTSFEEAAPALEEELRERRPSLIELAAFRNSLRREASVRILPGMTR